MEPVKISWEKNVAARTDGDLLNADPATLSQLAEQVSGSNSRCVRLTSDILVELPPDESTQGDVLIYMIDEGWLVRRNYGDYWYVDMGVTRSVGADLYCWTDLWLDVTITESADRYRLLDADEFAEAIESNAVASGLAGSALKSLHRLIGLVEAGDFPTPQIHDAVAKAYSLKDR